MAGWRETDEDGEARVLEKTVSSLSVKSWEKSKWIWSQKKLRVKRLTLAYWPIHNHQHGPGRMTSPGPKFYHSSSKWRASGPFHRILIGSEGGVRMGRRKVPGCQMEFISLFIIGRIKRGNSGNPDNSAEIEELHKLWENRFSLLISFKIALVTSSELGSVCWFTHWFSVLWYSTAQKFLSSFLIPAFQVMRALCNTWGGGLF